MKVLFIGDIVGSVGREAVKQVLPALKSKYNPDIIIANGENAAAGRGITRQIANEFYDWGIHGITMGNHTWDNKNIFEDRKSTRLNSSHVKISYAVFCLKKKIRYQLVKYQ